MEQAGPIALGLLQEGVERRTERSFGGVEFPDRSEHLFIVLAHRLSTLVLVIGEHVGRLMDECIGLLDRGPQCLRLLEARVSTRNEALARWEEGCKFGNYMALTL